MSSRPPSTTETAETLHVRLGGVEAFTDLPAPITIGSRRLFLVRDEIGFKLLLNVCPHQGGAVYDEGTRFECPQHGWRFDRQTGRCLNAPSRSLTAFPVTVEHGILYAELPQHARIDHVSHQDRTAKTGLTIQLHAHACLEIARQEFTLLTDPWLDGPAFLGAWAPYPPHQVSGADLRPDAILITHEHSDHFHEPTLQHFERATPVYVPDFPNQRMPRRLAALGFRDVRTIRFGETVTLADGWHVTAFEPASYWNDAIVLVDVGGFRILNINDAGINAHIARQVSPVDVLALQFSGGASGYPWTWAHLSDEQKIDISARDCAGKLRMIAEATSVYQARAVLPFASHFTLWLPQHRAYARMMKRNTLADVRTSVERTDAVLIDLLPGDRWDVDRDAIERECDDAARLFDGERLVAYMNTAVSDVSFAAVHPSREDLSRQELTEYLLQLNDVPEIANCENVTARICAADERINGQAVDVSFAIASGHVAIVPTLERPNININIPPSVLTAVVREGLSWDEAFIGCWCRCDRNPNVYHAGFWRLLQAPYYKRAIDVQPSAHRPAINRTSTVAEVIEAYGAPADRILRRYGLYCSGCHHSMADSIDMAARQHGIDGQRVELLIGELNRAFVS